MASNPGDIVIVDFVGARQVKRRPVVVVSSVLYHTTRPDVIVAQLTSQPPPTLAPTDYALQDWSAVGLRLPSFFRAYLNTVQANMVFAFVGRLTDRDWQEVQNRLRAAVAV